MKTLRTAQVCVIDDEPREYLRLLRALNSLGIACVHVSGDKVELLPNEPFEGLRLVFLDMHLGTHGGMDARSVTAHTAKVFSRVVSPDCAPIVVIVWTKYADLISSFREALFEAIGEFRGRIFIVRLDKPHPPARVDVSTLKGQIEAELEKLHPLPTLWQWNSLVHRAAAGVGGELCKLAVNEANLTKTEDEAEERTKVLAQLNSVLRALLDAEAGKTVSAENAGAKLFDALGPLHADRLDRLISKPKLASSDSILAADTSGAKSKDLATALNTMLLLGSVEEENPPFCPGTIFRIVNSAQFEAAFHFSVQTMAACICQKDLLKKESEEKLKEWLKFCHPILIEISPGCDFAQQKRPLSRFVGGFLLAPGHEKSAKKASIDGDFSLRALPLVRISSIDESTGWLPILCGQIFAQWPEQAQAPGLIAVGRLKDPALSDLRNWFAGQTARLGYLSVESKAK